MTWGHILTLLACAPIFAAGVYVLVRLETRAGADDTFEFWPYPKEK